MDMKPAYPPRMEGWQFQYNRAEKAQADADRRLELLERLIKQGILEGDILCEVNTCDDCDLIREIVKELTDASGSQD